MKARYVLVAAAAFACSHATRADQMTGSASDQLQEITITAEKRKEPLMKAPLAVTALSPAKLQAAGVVKVTDLPSVAPGMEVNVYPLLNIIQLSIRGMSSQAQGSDPLDSTVATYVDGVYSPNAQFLGGAMYDLSGVEVLRGPQGILYGENAPAGSVNIITADPTSHFGAAYDISYGNYGDLESHGMLNVPIDDTLSVRGAFFSNRSDGYYNTDNSTARNLGAADDRAGRLTALWKPTDDFKWRLAVDDYVANDTTVEGIPTTPSGAPVGNVSLVNGPILSTYDPKDDINDFSIRSRMDWKIDAALALSYIAGYMKGNYNYASNFQASLATFATSLGFVDSNSTYQEADLNLDTGKWRNILGATYSTAQASGVVDDPIYSFALNIAPVTNEKTKSRGVFDQATFLVTNQFRLIGGLRYSSDWKYDAESDEYCPVNVILSRGGSQSLCTIPGGAFQRSATWTRLDWKAGVEYDLSARSLAYFTATTGYKAGGFNNADPNYPEFKPESVISYELGVKNSFFDDRASLNVALFYENFNNIQVTQQTLFTFTGNAGAARIYGAEFEGRWNLTDHDRLDAYFTPLSATYTNYKNAVNGQTRAIVPSLDGHYLPDAPVFSGRFQYEHDFPLPNGGLLTPSVALYAQSVSYLREFNLPVDRVPAYTKTILRLTYQDPTGSWRAAAYVDNLENNVIRTGYQTILGYYDSYYQIPRTFGVKISYTY